ATNKANRAVQKIYHTHRSKPFNITQEEKEKEKGGLISRGDLFLATHKPGKKGWPNKETLDMYEAVEENATNLDIDPAIGPDDAVGRVYKGKEKPGRVRHMGAGKKPSVVFHNKRGSTSTATPTLQVQDPLMRQFGLAMIEELKWLSGGNPLSPEMQNFA
ncbi:hypothetical protein LINPERPRIM_LOCUS17614, partial [Linum perenne]